MARQWSENGTPVAPHDFACAFAVIFSKIRANRTSGTDMQKPINLSRTVKASHLILTG